MKKNYFLTVLCCVAMAFAACNTMNGHEYVDLGLPSGTKWATCNVGATAPEEYGNHYAWGETTTKGYYSGNNYKYCPDYGLTKYCNKSRYGEDGFTDKLITLEASDDAATANWGRAWRMPTDAEWTELRENCEWTWTTDYNSTGVAGCIVASKTNDNSIFLPAAGFCEDYCLAYLGLVGGYWSSSLSTDDPSEAWYASFGSVDGDFLNGGDWVDREAGLSVRPVCSSSVLNHEKKDNKISARSGRSASLLETVEGYWWYSWGHDGFDYLHIKSDGKCDFNFGTGEKKNFTVQTNESTKEVIIYKGSSIEKKFVYNEDRDILEESNANYEMWRTTEKELQEELNSMRSGFDDEDYNAKAMQVVDNYIEERNKTDYLSLNMKGTIGSSYGTLQFDEQADTGAYTYKLSSATVKRTIKLDRYEGNQLILKSFDLSNKYIGKFDGTLTETASKTTYIGTFTNYKGAFVQFNLAQ